MPHTPHIEKLGIRHRVLNKPCNVCIGYFCTCDAEVEKKINEVIDVLNSLREEKEADKKTENWHKQFMQGLEYFKQMGDDNTSPKHKLYVTPQPQEEIEKYLRNKCIHGNSMICAKCGDDFTPVPQEEPLDVKALLDEYYECKRDNCLDQYGRQISGLYARNHHRMQEIIETIKSHLR